MAYDFYLKKCLLPVPPEKLQVKINNANETVTLIDEGEVNVLKTAGLTDIEFDCLIPNAQYPFATYASGFKKAKHFLNYFEKLKTSKQPFQFIVSREMPSGKSLYSTNMKVSMESYTIEDNVDEGFDVTVKIKLKQYREYGTKTVKVTVAKTASTSSTRSTETAPSSSSSTYTIQSGDTLWAIAKKYYGNGAKYTTIYNANKSTIEAAAKSHGKSSSDSGHWIWAGTVLTIPAA